MKDPILVQGAMEVEIRQLKSKLDNIKEVLIDDYVFYKGTYKEYPVIISLTKIGSINATIATMLGIKEFSPLYIINQGVAGGQAKNICRGDLIIGTECKNSASRNTLSRKEGEGVNPFEWEICDFYSDDNFKENVKYESDKYLVDIAKKTAIEYKYRNVHVGILGSADTWDKEADYIIWLNKNLGIISADMESIGTYTVAKKYNIPVIGIRVISDNAILHEDYNRNVAEDVQNFVLIMLERLIKDKVK